ncbi:hypothetical protein RND81_11G142800 [Saponaria officinalis]|uniref:Retrotransposon gag domain-containing protein n=1 Tax=Saponaria officinalis TaxID=3572 RepID=A0AAW1HLV6_SAPOF
MTNLAKLEFVALDITGKNYLSWMLDAEIHLDAKRLGETIKEGNKTTCQEKAKAMIFLRHHLHEGLKNEYLTVKDPQILWSILKDRYDHQRTVILPKARYEWLHLRLQDFKSVSEYNSSMFRITSQLKLCGEKITDEDIEKGFKKYSELISCLLVAEQNNELLMKNHESRPTGSTPLPEANVSFNYKRGPYDNHYTDNSSRGRGRGRSYSRGRGRGFGGYGRSQNLRVSFKKKHSHQKWGCKEGKGRKGHWSRVCRTPMHLVNLYQQSLKQKRKNVETNLVIEDGEGDFASGSATHLEVDDFLSTPERTM